MIVKRPDELPSMVDPMAERMLRAGILFATNIVLARVLGPERFGEYAGAFALYSLTAAFTTWGVAGTLAHSAAKGADSRLLLSIISIRALAAMAMCAIALPVAALLLPFNAVTFSVLGIALIAFSLEAADHYLQGKQQFRHLAVAKTGALTVVCIGTILWAVQDRPTEWLLASRLSEWPMAILLLFAFGAFAHSTRQISWRRSFDEATGLARRSTPLLLATVAAAIYLKIDILMLSWLSSKSEVAQYSVAAQLSEAWYLLPTAVGVFLLPMLTRIRATNPVHYVERLQYWSNVLLYSSIFIALLMSMLADPIVSLLYGSQFADAGGILRIHAWAGIFVFFRVLISKWIIIEDLIWISLKTQLLGAISNIALNIMLIPDFGGVGAAYATLISYALASYVGLRIWPESRAAARIFERSAALPFITAFRLIRPKQ